MKIHEVVPLDKKLKRKVLDYCRKQKIRGDLIYLGKGSFPTDLSDKYNGGEEFDGLFVQGDYIQLSEDSLVGTLTDVDYFAFYKDFKNKSIVQKPAAKPNKEDKAAEPDSLTARLISIEQTLDTLLDIILALKVEK